MPEWMANNALVELAILGVAIGAGIFGSLLGLGGGVVIVPALTLGFGVPFRYAVGASIISVIATSSGAAATYVRDHITNIRVAMLLEMATTVGALCGALLSTMVDSHYLYMLFAMIMVWSAGAMLLKRGGDELKPEQSSSLAIRLKLPSTYPDAAQKREVAYGVRHVPLGFCLMLGAGVISALLGIGSGTLKVPAMDTAMHLPIKVSSATSNFMMGVTAAASAGHYYMRGEVLPFLAAPIAIGVIIGSWLGAKIMMRMRGIWIRRMFIGILMLIALQMGLRAFGVQVFQ